MPCDWDGRLLRFARNDMLGIAASLRSSQRRLADAQGEKIVLVPKDRDRHAVTYSVGAEPQRKRKDRGFFLAIRTQGNRVF